MFHVTASAISALRDVIDADDVALRVTVSSGGCSGVRYWMALDASVRSGDVVYVRDGVRFVVDGAAAPLLRGATIDFVTAQGGGGFVFQNPNFAGRCSCAGATAVAAE